MKHQIKRFIAGAIALVFTFSAGFLIGRKQNFSPEVSVTNHSSKAVERRAVSSSYTVAALNQGTDSTEIINEDSNETLEEQAYQMIKAYRVLAKDNPEEALTQALALPDGLVRNQAILASCDEWSSSDSKAAFDWLIMNQEGVPNVTELYTAIMSHHMKDDPNSAGQLILEMSEGSLKTSLAGHFAQHMSELDPNRSLEWSEALADPVARQQAMEVSIQALAQKDQVEAFEYALKQNDPDIRDQLLNDVGLVMARMDPQSTANQIDDFPKSVRIDITRHVASSWSSVEPQATADWIGEMALGPIRDRAVESAMNHLLLSNHSETLALASSVNDSAKRYGLIRDVLLNWYRTEPEYAEELLKSSSHLSELQKESLLVDIQKAPIASSLVVP